MEYKNFRLSKKENILVIAGVLLALLMLSKLFYNNYFIAVVMLPVGFFIYKSIKKKIFNKKMDEVEIQFKDMLALVADFMQTGYSIENALDKSYPELIKIHGSNSIMAKEMHTIISQLKLNVNIEKIFEEFANKYPIESIITFHQTLNISKRTGGNMRSIIKNVCDTISLKRELKEEIKVSMNAKRLEQKVMMGIPTFLMVYVSVTSPGFLDIMYSTMMGRVIMTLCLAGYIIAYLWAEKIINVEV